ncbi:hypothetical protein BCR43DRAFT_494820 [Syncephalastrum racemosum]|uniref:PH domain-containing protein n=1 Tax=Syncephalastrum racemosum TaxID=13706 RepID=A0A1X2H8N2_SYNRA|nr:hypothetical protein BCR43DRAFT_494820 [Syncephalastrum racemosum]
MIGGTSFVSIHTQHSRPHQIHHHGWLHKLSWLSLRSPWRHRFFVLHGNELCYYKHPNDSKPSGTIALKHYNRVSRHPIKESPHAFRIESDCKHHRTQVLFADNDDDSRRWIELLQTLVEGAPSSPHACSPPSSNLAATMTTASVVTESGSVLDKWLERLDLQDEPQNHTSNTSQHDSGLPSLDAYRTSSSSSSSLQNPQQPQAFRSTDSLDSSASEQSPATSYSSSFGNAYRGTGVLAQAFAQSRIQRRVTMGSHNPASDKLQTHKHPHRVSTPVVEEDQDWELFHFEPDEHRIMQAIPPSSPPPKAPLPPPPRQHSRD